MLLIAALFIVAIMLVTLPVMLVLSIPIGLFFPALLLTLCGGATMAFFFALGLLILSEAGPKGGGTLGKIGNGFVYTFFILFVILPVSLLLGTIVMALLFHPLIGLPLVAVGHLFGASLVIAALMIVALLVTLLGVAGSLD